MLFIIYLFYESLSNIYLFLPPPYLYCLRIHRVLALFNAVAEDVMVGTVGD